MCLATPQHENRMTRPRPAFGAAHCAPFGVGCAAARYARLRCASPEGGAAGRRKHIYRKQFTPAGGGSPSLIQSHPRLWQLDVSVMPYDDYQRGPRCIKETVTKPASISKRFGAACKRRKPNGPSSPCASCKRRDGRSPRLQSRRTPRH